MSGDCEYCGEHCLECRCEENSIMEFFDEKLLAVPDKIGGLRFKRLQPQELEDQSRLGCAPVYTPMLFASEQVEEKIEKLSIMQLMTMAEVMADSMVETYKELVFEDLMKLKEKSAKT